MSSNKDTQSGANAQAPADIVDDDFEITDLENPTPHA